MKKLLGFIVVAIALASCATTKTSKVIITPAGEWDFSVTGTPEGDFVGVMNIAPLDKAYIAKMNVGGGEQSIEKFNWDEPNKKINGEILYSGYNVFLDATMEAESLTGTMSAEGMSFPFKATRKK